MAEKFYIKHPYLASILLTITMMLITIAGNAVVFANHVEKALDGGGQYGGIYYLVLTLTNIICIIIAVCLIKKHDWSFSTFGFQSIISDSAKKTLYFIPLIIEILFNVIASGMNIQLSPLLILIIFIFTISVGFTEEMYYRGFVFKYLSRFGIKKAIIISSIIFGIVHLATAFRGDNMLEVILRIFFAFMFGVVCAEIFCITRSLWSIIIFHCLHDFVSYVINPSIQLNIAGISASNMLLIFEILDFLIIAVYSLYLWKKIK